MITKKIEFSGVEYPCRIVKDNQGEYLIIGCTALLDALQPGSSEDWNEGFASEEASDIYDEIFFFTDEHAPALPDKELVEELRRDSPEWF